MFFAGSDTTASTVAWTLYELSQNDALQSELSEEIDAAVAAKAGACLSPEELDRMPLLNACIKESLRLYPPAPIVGRDVPHNCTIGGYDVEKGDVCIIDLYSLHR